MEDWSEEGPVDFFQPITIEPTTRTDDMIYSENVQLEEDFTSDERNLALEDTSSTSKEVEETCMDTTQVPSISKDQLPSVIATNASGQSGSIFKMLNMTINGVVKNVMVPVDNVILPTSQSENIEKPMHKEQSAKADASSKPNVSMSYRTELNRQGQQLNTCVLTSNAASIANAKDRPSLSLQNKPVQFLSAPQKSSGQLSPNISAILQTVPKYVSLLKNISNRNSINSNSSTVVSRNPSLETLSPNPPKNSVYRIQNINGKPTLFHITSCTSMLPVNSSNAIQLCTSSNSVGTSVNHSIDFSSSNVNTKGKIVKPTYSCTPSTSALQCLPIDKPKVHSSQLHQIKLADSQNQNLSSVLQRGLYIKENHASGKSAPDISVGVDVYNHLNNEAKDGKVIVIKLGKHVALIKSRDNVLRYFITEKPKDGQKVLIDEKNINSVLGIDLRINLPQQNVKKENDNAQAKDKKLGTKKDPSKSNNKLVAPALSSGIKLDIAVEDPKSVKKDLQENDHIMMKRGENFGRKMARKGASQVNDEEGKENLDCLLLDLKVCKRKSCLSTKKPKLNSLCKSQLQVRLKELNILKKFKISHPQYQECCLHVKRFNIVTGESTYKIRNTARKSTTKLPKTLQTKPVTPSQRDSKPKKRRKNKVHEKRKLRAILPKESTVNEPVDLLPTIADSNVSISNEDKDNPSKMKYMMVKTNAGTFLVPTDSSQPPMVLSPTDDIASGSTTQAKIVNSLPPFVVALAAKLQQQKDGSQISPHKINSSYLQSSSTAVNKRTSPEMFFEGLADTDRDSMFSLDFADENESRNPLDDSDLLDEEFHVKSVSKNPLFMVTRKEHVTSHENTEPCDTRSLVANDSTQMEMDESHSSVANHSHELISDSAAEPAPKTLFESDTLQKSLKANSSNRIQQLKERLKMQTQAVQAAKKTLDSCKTLLTKLEVDDTS